MLRQVITGGQYQRPGAIYAELLGKRDGCERLGDAASGRDRPAGNLRRSTRDAAAGDGQQRQHAHNICDVTRTPGDARDVGQAHTGLRVAAALGSVLFARNTGLLGHAA